MAFYKHAPTEPHPLLAFPVPALGFKRYMYTILQPVICLTEELLVEKICSVGSEKFSKLQKSAVRKIGEGNS